MRNDVLAPLKMMLRVLHANDVVPSAQMKILVPKNEDF
jgi:hypothetical protein